MFLSDEDLYTLTRRRQGKRQAEVLRKMGIPFYLTDGRPIVTRAAIEGRERRRIEPFNFDKVI